MSRGVCVITGGSRGIGAAVAKRAARDGWDILINYNANAGAAGEVAEAVRRAGRRAETVQGNVATPEGIAATFEAADRFGKVTALINNAGVGEQVGTIDTFSFERVNRIVTLNVTGAIMCAREAVVRMARSKGGEGGTIINLSSAAAVLGAPHQFVDYAATKGAMDTLTVGLAHEWAGDGVRVCAVRPGVIDTEFHANVGVPDRPAKVGPGLPMGRAGTPEEVAGAISWLMSDEAAYSSGAIIDVSGARSIVP